MRSFWSQIGARAMAKSGRFLNKKADPSIIETLEYYLNHQKKSGDITYLEIDGKRSIANNAFIILLLLSSPEYPDAISRAKLFGDGL